MADLARGLVRRAFEAFNNRDLEGLLALLDGDVLVHSLMTEAEIADYRGHAGVRRWYAAVFDVFPDWSPQPREVRDLGDAAVVRISVTATAAGSGVRIEQEYWHAMRLRGERVDFFGFYRSEADALDALSALPRRSRE